MPLLARCRSELAWCSHAFNAVARYATGRRRGSSISPTASIKSSLYSRRAKWATWTRRPTHSSLLGIMTRINHRSGERRRSPGTGKVSVLVKVVAHSGDDAMVAHRVFVALERRYDVISARISSYRVIIRALDGDVGRFRNARRDDGIQSHLWTRRAGTAGMSGVLAWY